MPHMNERRTDATNGGKYATEREIGIICRTNKRHNRIISGTIDETSQPACDAGTTDKEKPIAQDWSI